MTPIEILHIIVDTDSEAQKVFQDAMALKTGFEDYVDKHLKEIKEAAEKSATDEIEKARILAKERADQKIERLDSQSYKDLQKAKKTFLEQRDLAVDKVFKMAVSFDA